LIQIKFSRRSRTPLWSSAHRKSAL